MRITDEKKRHIIRLLKEIYDKEDIDNLFNQLSMIINSNRGKNAVRTSFSEKDIVLITYADTIYDNSSVLDGSNIIDDGDFKNSRYNYDKTQKPLRVLKQFLDEKLRNVVSTIHLLPFYPYSSDDGFSVIDYKKVNDELGYWSDIRGLKGNFDFMCDLVANHISSKSDWFQEYMKGNTSYDDFFIELDKETDLSSVTRARAHSLLTHFTGNGKNRYLWTTFSADQIDLNYKNPGVLLKIVDILLFYASQGSSIIRLDAVGHIWKEVGTSCINLKKTHLIIQLFRLILDEVYPGVALLTETNVSHKENISYFGDGDNEAQLVYQFALMGLVLFTYLSKNTKRLMAWIDSLAALPARCTFLNVLATHDGIGIMPVKEILTREEIDLLVEGVKLRGGFVSHKESSEGERPYELNITYYSAIAGDEPDLELAIKKYLSSQAILLSMIGIPAIYIHSLIGTENYFKGVENTGEKRTINRRKYDLKEINNLLADISSRESRIFNAYLKLIRFRREEKAFHPGGSQKVVYFREEVFSIIRTSPDKEETILVMINVSNKNIKINIEIINNKLSQINLSMNRNNKDIISGQGYNNQEAIHLAPYQVIWLKL